MDKVYDILGIDVRVETSPNLFRGTGKLMKHRFTAPAIVATLSIACLVLMYFFHSPAAFIFIGLCLLSVFYMYVRYVKGQAEKERKQLLESVQRTAAATLGHHRHDWMNDLQILYGYIQLGKYDKLAGCVERIKERMAADSKISRLGIPSLVFYLHSFRELNSSVQLEVCIQEDLQLGDLLTAEDAEQFTEAVIATIRAYQFTGRSSWGEVLQLNLSICREGGEVLAVFERQDNVSDNVEILKRHLDEWNSGKRVLAEQIGSKRESLRLRVACAN
ncbi:sensor kinase SpoOB-type protein [Fontibacillus phaseoli]|uniref:Sensor kinase SpoOB-type protein n=2 Tax=Fontibacillus phaseoli TaxID=1416533 RepID=A0A369BHC7_9BACL|nr:sensor kinase SpoOB-type protein [Fontibacillus phaseoli]